MSFNHINLAGSDVVGWYNLPQPRSCYVYDMDGNGTNEADFDRLVDDATEVADGDVFFPDYPRNIIMTVESADAEGSQVTFSNAGRSPTYVNRAATGYQDGSVLDPWNTAWAGQGAVWPGGTVYLRADTYPEKVTIRKPCVLSTWGSGTVVIGSN